MERDGNYGEVRRSARGGSRVGGIRLWEEKVVARKVEEGEQLRGSMEEVGEVFWGWERR